MMVLISDERGVHHRVGPNHPESPARLDAVLRAAEHDSIRDAIIAVSPRQATEEEVRRVHQREMIDALELVRGREAHLDADTAVSPESVNIAWRAAGAGLTAVELLASGAADSAFCAVRPPGHHATSTTSMGFCLLNNVAVTAASLATAGERVLVADFDAHHGNGTQDVFYDDPNVLVVSWHQSPLYPGTGAIDEVGGSSALGATLNLPLHAGTTGDAYRASLDGPVGEVIDRFGPTWLLISAGFDAHRRDPITDMGLSAGDFADLTAALMETVLPGRTIAFLEGGYDLGALEMSALATMSSLAGASRHPEPSTSGSLGSLALRRLFDRVADAQGLR